MSPRISIRLLAAQSDQRLLALVREGHERAFEALVQRYRRPLLRYCRRTMNLSEERAEDVLQHALLQAWLALSGGTHVRALKPWLYRIVHNAAVNVMRSSSENVTELTDAMHVGTVGASESELERRIAVRDALSDVAALPRMQRQAIFLTAFDGQSHDEVAQALGITHGAVRGLLYRARSALRSAAAAIMPPSLLQWASGGAGSSAPSTERLVELSAGGGAIGMTGVLAKGAAIAVTAGALVTGAAVVHTHAAKRSSSRTSPAGLVRVAGGAGAGGAIAATAYVARGSALAASSGGDVGAQGAGAAFHRAGGSAATARHQARGGQRVFVDAPTKPGDAAGGSSPEVITPNRRHGDAHEGGGGNPANSSGSGFYGRPGGHGGRDSDGESNASSNSSGRGSGSDHSGGGGAAPASSGEAPPAPGTGPGVSVAAVPHTARSGGDHVALSAEPTSKTDG